MLLRKGVYPFEYMKSWERFNETSLPDKKAFYSELNLEDITDKDYAHAQKMFEEFKLETLGEYHWLVCSKWYIIGCRCIWKTLGTSVLKNMNLIPLNFCLHRD